MIAQEVEKIIPSIVSCEETKGIAYGKLVAVLVEGMKEQQRQIDDLKKDLNYFRNYNP
jgi:vacuolar-type H+-ATPase subunit B/Vma2